MEAYEGDLIDLAAINRMKQYRKDLAVIENYFRRKGLDGLRKYQMAGKVAIDETDSEEDKDEKFLDAYNTNRNFVTYEPGIKDDIEADKLYNYHIYNMDGSEMLPGVTLSYYKNPTQEAKDWYMNRRLPMFGIENTDFLDTRVKYENELENPRATGIYHPVFGISIKNPRTSDEFTTTPTVVHEFRHAQQKSFPWIGEKERNKVLGDAYSADVVHGHYNGRSSKKILSRRERETTNTENAYWADKYFGQEFMDKVYDGTLEEEDPEEYEWFLERLGLHRQNGYEEAYYQDFLKRNNLKDNMGAWIEYGKAKLKAMKGWASVQYPQDSIPTQLIQNPYSNVAKMGGGLKKFQWAGPVSDQHPQDNTRVNMPDYSMMELNSQPEQWDEDKQQWLEDYSWRWKKLHNGEPYDLSNIKYVKKNVVSVDEAKKIADGRYDPKTNPAFYGNVPNDIYLVRGVFDKFGEDTKDVILKEELAHALRANQHGPFLYNAGNSAETTDEERKLLHDAYILNDDAEEAEYSAANSSLRGFFMKKSGKSKEELDSYIDNLPDNTLLKYYYKNGHVDTTKRPNIKALKRALKEVAFNQYPLKSEDAQDYLNYQVHT